MVQTVPITVVETPEFLSATRKLMTDDERALLVDYLAYNPMSGDLIPGNYPPRCEGGCGVIPPIHEWRGT